MQTTSTCSSPMSLVRMVRLRRLALLRTTRDSTSAIARKCVASPRGATSPKHI